LRSQEERVLALVAEGLTNKEIAAALQLSDKTVKNYLSNMFQKLHITRRAQAATFFVMIISEVRELSTRRDSPQPLAALILICVCLTFGLAALKFLVLEKPRCVEA
jgi:DNA-binding CsgD family transcriptional regulator